MFFALNPAPTRLDSQGNANNKERVGFAGQMEYACGRHRVGFLRATSD